MKKIILIRHGITGLLEQNRYQGWSDPPLSEAGRKEIETLRERFNSENPDIVFSSPLKRAHESARLLTENVIADERIKEMSFGKWEGRTYNEIVAEDPEAFEWWKRDLTSFRPGEGENISELRERVRSFYLDLKQKPEETIAIATHGGVIRAFILELLDLPPDFFWKINLETAGMTIINCYPEQNVLSLLNWKPFVVATSVACS